MIERAKEIIAANKYMTLATASLDGEPWSTPVFMLYDENHRFYWLSFMHTKHSENIHANDRVAITVFDSHVLPNETAGMYIQARAHMITDPSELEKIVILYCSRTQKPLKPVQDFLGDDGRRFYCAVPEKIWVNADGIKKRIEISITDLQAS